LLSDGDRIGIEGAVGSIVAALAEGDVESILRRASGSVLPADELRAAVREAGGGFVYPSKEEWSRLAVTAVPGTADALDVVMALLPRRGAEPQDLLLRVSRTPSRTFTAQVVGLGSHRAAAPRPPAEVAPAPTAPPALAADDGTSWAVPVAWRPALSEVVDRLVADDLVGLVADGLLAADTADRIRARIAAYPATLVPLPDAAWDDADCGPWPDRPGEWWVVVPLWTAEEGRSDLVLEGAVSDIGPPTVRVDLVHVM
jgi:hypothetical protein